MKLRDYTPARVSLGLAGDSLPTAPLLDFRLAHARARDAVHFPLNSAALIDEMGQRGWAAKRLHSCAANRDEYLRRPDKGRTLDSASVAEVQTQSLVVIVADGLSALAVHRHAVPLLAEALPQIGFEPPLWIVEQGRVAISDHVGETAKADLAVIILGERPGLSTPDSLGIYITWAPRVGRTDAERNCISNIHAHGLSYEQAAFKLAFLVREARRRRLTGVTLKETTMLEDK